MPKLNNRPPTPESASTPSSICTGKNTTLDSTVRRNRNRRMPGSLPKAEPIPTSISKKGHRIFPSVSLRRRSSIKPKKRRDKDAMGRQSHSKADFPPGC